MRSVARASAARSSASAACCASVGLHGLADARDRRVGGLRRLAAAEIFPGAQAIVRGAAGGLARRRHEHAVDHVAEAARPELVVVAGQAEGVFEHAVIGVRPEQRSGPAGGRRAGLFGRGCSAGSIRRRTRHFRTWSGGRPLPEPLCLHGAFAANLVACLVGAVRPRLPAADGGAGDAADDGERHQDQAQAEPRPRLRARHRDQRSQRNAQHLAEDFHDRCPAVCRNNALHIGRFRFVTPQRRIVRRSRPC